MNTKTIAAAAIAGLLTVSAAPLAMAQDNSAATDAAGTTVATAPVEEDNDFPWGLLGLLGLAGLLGLKRKDDDRTRTTTTGTTTR